MPSQSAWYARTLVPPSPWKAMSTAAHRSFVNFFWVATLCTLVLGFVAPAYWIVAIGLTGLQTATLWALVGYRPLVFSVQLRLVFAGWLTVGTCIDACWFMMPIATLGLGANLSFNYCLLSRLLHLLPWNRTVPLTRSALKRILLQPPRPGRFQLEMV